MDGAQTQSAELQCSCHQIVAPHIRKNSLQVLSCKVDAGELLGVKFHSLSRPHQLAQLEERRFFTDVSAAFGRSSTISSGTPIDPSARNHHIGSRLPRALMPIADGSTRFRKVRVVLVRDSRTSVGSPECGWSGPGR
jgi:hypothetical protein